MKQAILILGAGILQGPAIRLAKEEGLYTIVVDGNPRASLASCADRFEPIDLKDKEAILAFARDIQKTIPVVGVMTAGTDFSATVAYVAEHLGLPGIPYERALDASDKERMRQRFKEAGVPSPDFVVLKEQPPFDWIPPFPFPVVVKPVDNMGARGCRRADTVGEVHHAIAGAFPYSRSGRVIVEAYMEGPEYSVDAIVYEGTITICGVADRHIFFPPYFIEMGHTMPTATDPVLVEQLIAVFSQGVRALGITHGAAKGDVKLTSQGPMIGEIAARLSGGYMSGWTYPYASGGEPTRAAIQVAIGKKPDALVPRRSWTSAERAFISIPGTIKEIRGLEAARAVPLVRDVFPRVSPGDVVQFPENNVTKCGNVISAAPERFEAIEAAERAVRHILIRLQYPDERTEAFLQNIEIRTRGEVAFPPDAYSLPPDLLSAIKKLPDSPSLSPSPEGAIELLVVPGLLEVKTYDYVGRSLREGLAAVELLTGVQFHFRSFSNLAEEVCGALGRKFWLSFVRGGYQGAVYYLDALRK
ncbi:MAG: ATP-grasp domain-containing protein [Treponemataceae bacterium]|nr:ATP-grasp domain-containing protein [Treponemataceae bacterium]